MPNRHALLSSVTRFSSNTLNCCSCRVELGPVVLVGQQQPGSLFCGTEDLLLTEDCENTVSFATGKPGNFCTVKSFVQPPSLVTWPAKTKPFNGRAPDLSKRARPYGPNWKYCIVPFSFFFRAGTWARCIGTHMPISLQLSLRTETQCHETPGPFGSNMRFSQHHCSRQALPTRQLSQSRTHFSLVQVPVHHAACKEWPTYPAIN
jgi:hypothetical protein